MKRLGLVLVSLFMVLPALPAGKPRKKPRNQNSNSRREAIQLQHRATTGKFQLKRPSQKLRLLTFRSKNRRKQRMSVMSLILF